MPCPAYSSIVTFAQESAVRDPLLSALLLAELNDYSANEPDRKFALQIATTVYPEAMISGSGPFQSLEFAADGKTFVTAGNNGAEIWTANTWKRAARWDRVP